MQHNTPPKNSIQEFNWENNKLKESFRQTIQHEFELKRELRKLSYKNLIDCIFSLSVESS